MIKFSKDYLAINHQAKEQAASILARRDAWVSNQLRLAEICANDRDAYEINAGIPTKDFFQEVDRTILGARTNEKYRYVEDLAGIATPVNIGSLSHVNLTSSDISDQVTRTMDLQGLKQFDSITAGNDRNPIPGFQGGVGMNYRHRMGLQREGIDLMLEGIARKTIKMSENIGDYMTNGDAAVVADGVAGEGIKNHRNTRKLNLGAAGYNIDLTTATADNTVKFWQQDMKLVANEEVISKIDKVYVSPEIMTNMLQPLSGADGFKMGTLLEQVLRFAPHIGAIEQDFALSGNEWLGYVRDRQVISPLVALPLTNYQKIRQDPYENFNTCMIAVQGLKIAQTYNGKRGVFYASEIS
jgi:hypothetical protein